MRKEQIPNLLTIGRVVAIPLFILCLLLPDPTRHAIMLLLFILASITDWLDGWLARKWNATSDLGRMLDPVADKLLVATALILLALEGLAPGLAVLFILLRELLVSGLRETVAAKGISLPVTRLAKYKTALQMLAIPLLLAAPLLPGLPVLAAGEALLWLAAVVTLITGADYLNKALKAILRP